MKIKWLMGNFKSIYSFFHGASCPSGPRRPIFRSVTVTFRDITIGRTSLDEWSARRRQHTKIIRDRHPYSRRDSYPQSQQASSCISTPFSVVGRECLGLNEKGLARNSMCWRPAVWCVGCRAQWCGVLDVLSGTGLSFPAPCNFRYTFQMVLRDHVAI
jgi:hypothetical protein